MILCGPATLNASQTKIFIRGHSATLDSSPSNKTITNNGGVTVVDAPGTPGGKALNFNGSSQYLSTPTGADFNFDKDFTIDWWMFTAWAAGAALMQTYGGGDGWWIGTDPGGANGKLRLYSYTDFDYVSTITYPASTYCHCALVRYGNVMRFAVNGVLDPGSQSFSGTVMGGTSVNFEIGKVSSIYLTGKLQMLRVTRFARWPGFKNFIPPTKY